MQILTRNEAAHRAATLEVSAIDVTVDVSGAMNTSRETYPVTSILTLVAREERTFIDIAGQVEAVRRRRRPCLGVRPASGGDRHPRGASARPLLAQR